MSKKRMNDNHLKISLVRPITQTQEAVFISDKNIVLYGSAGTGKTFLSSYLGYEAILEGKEYTNLVIIRSAVPSRDIGFLPGSEKEKASVYEEPYKAIATELFGRGDAYHLLKTKGIVQFMTTSYLRGLTLWDSVVIVDECQNLDFHELDTIITRIGSNCKIFFCGDFDQSDLKNNGMNKFLSILKETGEFDFVRFGVDDIVRSGLVKKYLIAKNMVLNGQ